MINKLTSYFFIIVFLFSSECIYAQSSEADSLIQLIKKDKLDTNKVNHLNALAVQLWDNLDTAIICSKSALELAKSLRINPTEKGWLKGIGKSEYLLGVFHFDQGNYIKALSYNEDALKIWEDLEKKTVGPELNTIKFAKTRSLGEVGIAYENLGNYPKALEYELRALKLNEELKWEKGIGSTYGNIGNIYINQKQFTKALDCYTKSLKVGRKLGHKEDQCIDLKNIANVYKQLGNPSKAQEYILMSLVIAKETGNEAIIADNLGGIGTIIKDIADSALAKGKDKSELIPDYEKSMDYFRQSLELDEKLGILNGAAINYSNIGGIYFLQKKYTEAEKYLLKALDIDTTIGSMLQARGVEEDLSYLYTQKEDFRKALYYYKKYSQTKDLLFNEEKDKEITRHEMNYEFDKKEAELKAAQDKKEAIAESEKTKQNIFFWLVSLVAIAIAIIAMLIFRSLRITSKQKNIIGHQKELVEEKQREILDSIHYAKRIQQSLLPNEKYIHKNLQRLNKKS